MTEPHATVARQEQPSPASSKLPYLFILLSCVAWVSGYVYSNNHNISPFETGMLRGFMLCISSYLICKYNGDKMDFRNPKQFRILTFRNVFFCLHGLMVAWMQFYIPLSIFHTIGGTGPLCVIFIQIILEKKKPTPTQRIGIFCSFIGLVLNANGRLISHALNPDEQFETSFENYKSTSSLTIALLCFLFFGNMILWAYAVYLTNKIKTSTFQINYHFSIMLLFVSTISSSCEEVKTDSGTFYWGILFTGIILAIAETAFITGIKLSTNIGITIMLGNFTAVMGYFYSIVLYGQKMNLFCLTGAFLIVFGIYKIIFGG